MIIKCKDNHRDLIAENEIHNDLLIRLRDVQAGKSTLNSKIHLGVYAAFVYCLLFLPYNTDLENKVSNLIAKNLQ